MDKVEIINLQKRCNKAGAKAAFKADTKRGGKVASSRYHLFLREQLGKMTEEDRINYRSIVSGRWKKIKEDPARLIAYNKRTKQMMNETEKPTKSGDDPSVGRMVQHEEMVTERPVVKNTGTAQKSP